MILPTFVMLAAGVILMLPRLSTLPANSVFLSACRC